MPAGVDLVWDISQRLCFPLRVIVDVGAHKGETIEYFHERVANCEILAFEPVPSTFEVLHARWGRTENVGLRNLAVAEAKSVVRIRLEPDSQTNSLRNAIGEEDGRLDAREAGFEDVRVSTLDIEVPQAFSGRSVDLLKIDVEGLELQVLRGAQQLLRDGAIRLILAEFTVDTGDHKHTHLLDLIACLQPYGYSLVGFYDQAIWLGPPRLGYGNALFALSP